MYKHLGYNICQQEEGIAMGLPLSLLVANIYTECVEEIALGATLLKPTIWLRCIDEAVKLLTQWQLKFTIKRPFLRNMDSDFSF